MIITRTPFRLSFLGGGSDLREFYARNGYGAVVSTAINKYMYIIIHPYFHDKIRIKYSRTEDVNAASEVRHPIARECLKKVGIESGVELASFADVPAGTGLGSSSSFTVGLLHALYAYKGASVSMERLAREASEIEIDILGEPIGKQDQYAAAYGNMNCIRFNSDETVEVAPIPLSRDTRKEVEERLCLYHVGGERRSKDILLEQKNNTASGSKVENLKKMVGLAEDLRDSLARGRVDELGTLLHQGWLHKRELASSITNGNIDSLYEKALRSGAEGGKLLGAGGTGFLLLYSRDHTGLAEAMGCRTMRFAIDTEGSKLIFYE